MLLDGANLWTIIKHDYSALERFHKRAARHITGKHIRWNAQGVWSYLDHDVLFLSCGLQLIKVYMKRRCGTLRLYLQEYKPKLLREVHDLQPLARNPHQVLWW